MHHILLSRSFVLKRYIFLHTKNWTTLWHFQKETVFIFSPSLFFPALCIPTYSGPFSTFLLPMIFWTNHISQNFTWSLFSFIIHTYFYILLFTYIQTLKVILTWKIIPLFQKSYTKNTSISRIQIKHYVRTLLWNEKEKVLQFYPLFKSGLIAWELSNLGHLNFLTYCEGRTIMLHRIVVRSN